MKVSFKRILQIYLIFSVIMSVLFLTNNASAASYLMITDLGSSAEMIRKGNIEGFSTGANSVFENPAGLHRVKQLSVSVFSSEIMDEVSYINYSLALNTSIGIFGFGYMEAGVDGIISTAMAENGTIEAIGTFAYKNSVVKLGYAKSITDSLHIGANAVGYLNEIHTYEGTGYSIDTGLIYQFSELEVSVFARNLIPMKVNYTDSDDSEYSGDEDLPLQMVLSASYPFGDLGILGQFKYDGVNTLMSAGVEYTPNFLLNALTISAGYKEYSILDKISNTITLGVGLDLFGVSLDYAYEQSDHFEYDAYNFASIGIDF